MLSHMLCGQDQGRKRENVPFSVTSHHFQIYKWGKAYGKKALPPTTYLNSLQSLDHHGYSNMTVTGLEATIV